MLELIPLRFGIKDGETTRVELLVRIRPPLPERLDRRPPLNISLVLDRSGSMSGEKIEHTLLAAQQAVQALLPDDRLSVVVFDTFVNLLIPSTRVIDKPSMLRALEGVVTGGSTALHAGWLEGATQVARHLDASSINRVLLLTDGQANVGETNADRIATDVNGLAQRGVATSTLGFGLDYNERLLRAMAASGDGNQHFVESPEQLSGIFDLELGGLLATVGQKVRLRVETSGKFAALTRLQEDELGRLRLNDLVGGNPLSLLLSFELAAASALVKIHLDYYDLHRGQEAQLTSTLQFPVVSAERWSQLPEAPDVLRELALLQASQARDEVSNQLERGDEAAATRILEDTLTRLRRLPDHPLLQRHIQELEEVRHDVLGHKLSAASTSPAWSKPSSPATASA